MTDKNLPALLIHMRPPNAASAAWRLSFCGHTQQAICRAYGDHIETH